MRNALPFALAAILVAAPALATDRQVPDSTLAAVGLSGLEAMSDAQGNQVRGMSTGVRSFGVSMVSGLIIDPVTNSFIFGSDANTASSAVIGGFAASQQTSAVSLNLVIESNGTYPGFYGTLLGGAGGSAFAND
jgi:hypothetical protein